MIALKLELTVYLVDVDVVFLKNPLPYLSKFVASHDLIIQGGLTTLNSGKLSYTVIFLLPSRLRSLKKPIPG